jgi:predicted nucleic acid-binding protein
MKVISDSSPLIGLLSIGKLDTLKALWDKVIIPEAVFHEVVVLGEHKTGAKEVRAACQDWLEVMNILVHFTMLHRAVMNERKYSRVSGTEKSSCPYRFLHKACPPSVWRALFGKF